MTGLPPLRIHLKDNATPVAVNRPSTISAHWIDDVRKELERDIDLGVIERVPSNTPTTLCSRMHIVGKKMGEPRRVVDLREGNNATIRQTHVTEPPFRQAMGVPPHTWRYSFRDVVHVQRETFLVQSLWVLSNDIDNVETRS